MTDKYKLFDTTTTTSVKSPSNRFLPVTLPSQDYIPATPTPFPKHVLVGFHGDQNAYTSETWSKFLLEKANGYAHATSVSSCSALNSGSSGGRYWFGYIFGGEPVSAKDFVKAPGPSEVTNALAFSEPLPRK